jgi:outer membrane protein assembly factor BamB
MTKNIFLIVIFSALIQACGASSNVRPPAPLVEIDSGKNAEVIWDESFGGSDESRKLQLKTAAINNYIYTVDADGELSAFNLEDGDDIWSVDLGFEITAGIGVSDELLFLGSRDGHVLAVNPKDGALVWDKRIATAILSVPVVSAGRVIVQAVNGKVYALDEKSGKQLWLYKKEEPSLSLRGTSSPIIVSKVVITGFATGTIAALTLDTGKQIWELPVSQPKGRNEIERLSDVDASPIVSDFRLFVASYHGKLVCIDIRSGEQIWSRDLSIYRNMSIDEKNIYVLDDRGVMFAFDKENGSTVWQQAQFVGRKPAPPAVVDGNIIVGDVEGYVHWLNADDGRILGRVQIDDSPIVAPALVRDAIAYVSSINGELAAVTIK